MRAPTLRIALLVAPLLTTAASLYAQEPRTAPDPLAARRSEWLVGVSVGVPGHDGESMPELLTIGANWTQLRAGRVGADFSLGTVPRTLTAGFVVVAARGGIALPLEVSPGMLLLPSGGLSVLGGFGAGGGGGTAGLNAGLSAVVLRADAIGLRTGVTWHRFSDADRAVWLWEVGLVRGPRRH